MLLANLCAFGLIGLNNRALADDTAIDKAEIAPSPKNFRTIEGLKWKSNTIKVENVGGVPVARLEGKLERDGVTLLSKVVKIFKAENGKFDFSFRVPLKSEVTTVNLSAIGPSGEVEETEIWIKYPGWKTMNSKDQGAPSEFWLIGRVAESVVAYAFDDPDLKNKASGAAVVGFISAEGRYRRGRRPSEKYTLSGSVNFEMIRQTVLGTDFNLPRGYARGFYTMGEENLRFGPFLQLQAGKSGIFEVVNETTAKKFTVMRYGFAIGGVGVLRSTQTVALSARGLIRMDFGGSDPQLPNPLVASIGYELGFGVVVGLTPRIMLEGRLRNLQESYAWKPAVGGSTNSTNSNSFILLDVGVGYKL